MKSYFGKIAFITFGLLLLSVTVRAQQHTVKGTVTDKSTGSPLAGVNILVVGTTTGAATDAEGHYSVTVPSLQDTLRFSFIGYQTQRVSINGRSSIDVSLSPSVTGLNQIAVTAFGIKHEDRKLGYSVTKVSGKALERTNTINPITALQGKVAGVQVDVSGTAGIQTSPYIQIRGANVLGGNNQPIIVVDGNVLKNNLFGPDATSSGSQLKNLNPDNYKSITVLKGAAATSLYGSRGINGAIIITTKSGHPAQGVGVELSSTFKTTQIYKPFMKLQNKYGMGILFREGAFRPDGSQDYNSYSFGPEFDGTMHPSVYNKNKEVPYIARPNNWRTFYQNGDYMDNHISLFNGTDKYSYRLSYSYTNANGILPNNGLKRNAVYLKARGDISKIFSVNAGINYANTKTSNYYNQSRFFWPAGQNLGFNVFLLPRNTNFKAWHQDYRNPDNTVKQPTLGSESSAVTNGFTKIDKDNFVRSENSLLAFAEIKADVAKWLGLSARGNINYLQIHNITKNFGSGKDGTGGEYAVGGNYTSKYDLRFMAHAKKQVSDFGIDFRLINEIYGTMLGESYGATTSGGLKVPNQFFLGNSVNDVSLHRDYGITLPNQLTIGLGGDLRLSYKNYLNVEVTGRNDWLSTLTYPSNVPGANNYSVFYPSVNVSYAFTGQFKDAMPSWLTFGKIRASLAYVGNAGVAGVFSTGSGFEPGTVRNTAGQSISIATPFNGNVRPNFNLKPQKQRSIELGTHLSFLNQLVAVDFTWYKTNTFNQLLHIPGVAETGFTKLYINAGNIQNTGVEFLLKLNPIRTRNWNLNFSVNLAHNKGKIIDFASGIDKWNLSGNYEGVETWAYKGGPFGVINVTAGAGYKVDPKTGYPLIKVAPRMTSTTKNENYDFADYQYVPTTEKTKIGNIQPALTSGFLATLSFKNISLFAQIDSRVGGYVYSDAWTYAMAHGTPLASLKFRDKAHGGVARTDSYTGKTRYNGAIPKAVFAKGETSPIKKGTNIGGMTFKEAYQKGLVEPWYAGYYYLSTYGWETNLNTDGALSKETWVMLRELTLSYQLPHSLLRKTNVIQSASLSVSAHNIAYLYNSLPGGQNPASVQSNNPFDPYITGGVPFARSFALSIDIKF